MYIKKQIFLVLGVSKSGNSAVKLLLKNNAKCYFYDDNLSDEIIDSENELKKLGAIKVNKEDVESIISKIDILVVSPGVPINHEICVLAKGEGKRIMGELELGFSYFNPPIIAVTGTNGKTTTVCEIQSIFEKARMKSLCVGNVGVPITSTIEKDCIYVAEVSSFQLESINSFNPHISCILNISPDHLERHYTMDNYVYLKKRIFKNQRESEYTILNFDDKIVKSFSEQTKGRVFYVSTKEKVDGAYCVDGKIYCFNNYIMDKNELLIKGLHNVYNTLFSIICAKLMGVDDSIICSALKEFKGVKHRLEFVCIKNEIKYINDSKSTNTSSTITAIRCVEEPIILLLGGSEKGEDYDLLFKEIKNSNVKRVILFGSSKNNMLKSANDNGLLNITMTDDFKTAVKISSIIAENGDTVLLSPACASFDEFDNFEQRGEEFIKLVNELCY